MKALCQLFWDIIIGKGFNRATEKTFNKRMSICRKNMCYSYQKHSCVFLHRYVF